MGLISLDELIFGELTEFQMRPERARPLSASLSLALRRVHANCAGPTNSSAIASSPLYIRALLHVDLLKSRFFSAARHLNFRLDFRVPASKAGFSRLRNLIYCNTFGFIRCDDQLR